MYELWSKEKWTRYTMQNMLSAKTWQLRFTFLRQLWERFYEKEIRVRQKIRNGGTYFYCSKSCSQNIKAIYRAKMYSMQSTSTQKNDEVLLTRVQAKRQKETEIAMPKLRQSILPNISKNSLLFEGMCRQSTQQTHERKTIHVTKMA